MKASDKAALFYLLKQADSYINGYISEKFSQEPFFQDDEEIKTSVFSGKSSVSFESVAGSTSAAAGASSVISGASVAGGSSVASVASVAGVDSPSCAEAALSAEPAAATSKITLNDIESKIHRCTRCALARTRNNVVPGEGVNQPLVMVVGEGPGEDEDMKGRPFVGRAGILLDKMLAAINLDRKTNCYIANIVKCRPPRNRDPLPEEQAACISFLEAQIHILKPKMILCMGRIAAQKLLDTQEPLGNLRGKVHDYNGIPLMVTYHPSALLRNEQLKRPAWEDLKLVRKELNEISGNNS